MRIGIHFHANDEYISGVEYYALGMIRALICHEPQNQYIVFATLPEIAQRYIGRHDHVKVMPIKYANTRMGRILWQHLCLPQLAERERLDVLHCPSYICPVRANKVPYVVTVHDTIALDHPEWCKVSNAIYYKFFLKWAARQAARIVVVSRQTGLDLGRHLARPTKVIYPGIDAIFQVRKSQSALRQIQSRYGLPEKYILYVGNFEPKKNLDALLRAYQLFVKKGFQHSLVCVGMRQWKNAQTVKRLSRGCEGGEIIQTGYVRRKDLPGVYQMASLYVCTSLYEGFGFPPLEAMACGVPVISSACGALKETLGDAAYVIDPSNPQQIAEAISDILTNSELRDKYARCGMKRCRLFSWSETARQLHALYSELAA